MGIDRVWAAEGRQACQVRLTFLFCGKGGKGERRVVFRGKGGKKGDRRVLFQFTELN